MRRILSKELLLQEGPGADIPSQSAEQLPIPATAASPNPWDTREPAVALRPIPVETIPGVPEELVGMFSATLWCLLCTIEQEDECKSKKAFQLK